MPPETTTFSAVACRRKQPRHQLPKDLNARVQLPRRGPGGKVCPMTLRDVSASGLSFTLAHALPGVDIGDVLEHARILVGRRTIHADLLVMHLTPGPTAGATCGALIYPATDRDIVAWQELIASAS